MSQHHELYNRLLKCVSNRRASLGQCPHFLQPKKLHPNQLEINADTEFIYGKLYVSNSSISNYKYPSPQQLIPEHAELCKSCNSFFFSQKRSFDKQEDFAKAAFYEECLRDFFNQEVVMKLFVAMSQLRMFPMHTKVSQTSCLSTVISQILYAEIKYNCSPFLVINSRIQGRRCYESPTLNTKKISRQHELVKSGEISVPVFYIYWIDFPCLKGVFAMSIEDVYAQFISQGVSGQYNRKSGLWRFRKRWWKDWSDEYDLPVGAHDAAANRVFADSE